MKTLSLIFLIVYSILFTSCKDEIDPAKRITLLNTTDTFLFEFPKREGIIDSFWYNRKINIEKALGMQSLERGFDSIQIRLWYGGAMVGQRLVVLSNKVNNWGAEISVLGSVPNPSYKKGYSDYNTEFLPIKTSEYKMPKSGWKNFINKLFRLNLLTLPDESAFAEIDRGAVADGFGVVIEIATRKVYRFYRYDNPDMYHESIPAAKEVSRILKLIDEEFALKKLWDYMNEEVHQNTPDTIKKAKVQEIQLQEIEPEEKKKKE